MTRPPLLAKEEKQAGVHVNERIIYLDRKGLEVMV
jgi:hypothetical protein